MLTDQRSVRPAGRGYSKYAWMLPLVTGIIFVTVGGPALAYYGCSMGCFGPAIPASTPAAAMTNLNLLVQEIAMFNFFFGVLLILVSWMGFRANGRLPWFVVLWFFFVAVADNLLFGVNPPAVIGLVLPGAGLLLTFRSAFPRT